MHIEDEIAAGRILPLDARETARALIWMSERYLLSSLGRTQTAAPETVVETLATIWTRTLYGAELVELASSARARRSTEPPATSPDHADVERRQCVAGPEGGREVGRVGEDARPAATAARRTPGPRRRRCRARSRGRARRARGSPPGWPGAAESRPIQPAPASRGAKRQAGADERRGRGRAGGRACGRPLRRGRYQAPATVPAYAIRRRQRDVPVLRGARRRRAAPLRNGPRGRPPRLGAAGRGVRLAPPHDRVRQPRRRPELLRRRLRTRSPTWPPTRSPSLTRSASTPSTCSAPRSAARSPSTSRCAAPERVRTLQLAVTWAGSGAYAREKTRLWASERRLRTREDWLDALLLATVSEEFYENQPMVDFVKQVMRSNEHPQEPDGFERQSRASSTLRPARPARRPRDARARHLRRPRHPAPALEAGGARGGDPRLAAHRHRARLARASSSSSRRSSTPPCSTSSPPTRRPSSSA